MLRNVLQAFEQPTLQLKDGIAFGHREAAAIVVRVKAALRELEQGEHVKDDVAAAIDDYVVDVVQGARMDGASLGGQEPEDAA
jgi:hypothetical protein